jgi:hypothetical protein
MKKPFILFFLIVFKITFGQKVSKEYNLYIRQADSLWQLKEYKNTGFAYSSAFKTLGYKGRIEDRYNAARAWSLANIQDSAFDCLERIIKKKYFSEYDMVVNEQDFKNLNSDIRWKPLLEQLKLNDSLFKIKIKAKGEYVNTIVIVKNNLDISISVYWLDYSNDEVFYFSLDPHQEKFQQTYIGHEWVIRQKTNSVKLTKFTVTGKYQKFNLFLPAADTK